MEAIERSMPLPPLIADLQQERISLLDTNMDLQHRQETSSREPIKNNGATKEEDLCHNSSRRMSLSAYKNAAASSLMIPLSELYDDTKEC
jgi:hypothetical protein